MQKFNVCFLVFGLGCVTLFSSCASLRDKLLTTDPRISDTALREYDKASDKERDEVYNSIIGIIDNKQIEENQDKRRNANFVIASMNPNYIICSMYNTQRDGWKIVDFALEQLMYYYKLKPVSMKEYIQKFPNCLVEILVKFKSIGYSSPNSQVLDDLIVETGDGAVSIIEEKLQSFLKYSYDNERDYYYLTALLERINTPLSVSTLTKFKQDKQSMKVKDEAQTMIKEESKKIIPGKIYQPNSHSIIYATTLEAIRQKMEMDMQGQLTYDWHIIIPENTGYIEKGEKFKVLKVLKSDDFWSAKEVWENIYFLKIYIYGKDITAYIFIHGVGGQYIPQVGFEK